MLFGPDYDLKIPALAADRFAVRSQMAMAIDAKADKPYLFGLHQCSRARVWTAEEQRLFQEIGRRLSDASRLFRPCAACVTANASSTRPSGSHMSAGGNGTSPRSRVSLSDEAQRIFGVQPVDLPQWQDRWVI